MEEVIFVIWHLGIGGMQKRITELVEDSKRNSKNIEFTVLVKYQTESPFEKRLKDAGVEIVYYANSKKNSNNIGYVLWLWRQLKRPADTIVAFLDYLSVLTVIGVKILGNKNRVVINESMVTSKYLEMQRGSMAWFWRLLISLFYSKADLIICPTKAGVNDLNSIAGRRLKTKVIPNWTLWDTNISDTKKLYDLIFVGRVDEEKGIDNLLEVWKKLRVKVPNTKLAVVGAGKDFERYQKLFKGDVEWMGMRSDVIKIIDKSKILVLPTKNEGMPNVVLEAGARGVPTVTLKFPGCNEIIQSGEDGLIVSNNLEMSGAIIRMLTNKSFAEKLGRRMWKKVRDQYGVERLREFRDYLLTG